MNFLEIDNIVTRFLLQNVSLYRESKKRYKIYLDIVAYTEGRIKSLVCKDMMYIRELEFAENILILYKTLTSEMIRSYLDILKTPIKSNSVYNLEQAEKKKRSILIKYVDVIRYCIPCKLFEKINLNRSININIDNYLLCEHCENREDFSKDGDIIICNNCYSEVIKTAYYNSRSNLIGPVKCNYDRSTHFKECLKQFQGTQNTYINPQVYYDIEDVLHSNGILVESSDRIGRFSNVRKSHILYFLKELGYSKHYDDYILIYSNLTGKPPNDLSHLEEVLLDDFEKVSEKYLHISDTTDRKNFINMQFILYKLLQRHKYNIEEDDFANMKSFEKKMDRENICRYIFKSLNWEYNE